VADASAERDVVHSGRLSAASKCAVGDRAGAALRVMVLELVGREDTPQAAPQSRGVPDDRDLDLRGR